MLEVSDGLVYRDFITVGLLLRSLRINDETPQGKKLISDNWIYIQEPDVLLGRLQIFNNWSPFMVADPANVWLGLEYFCNESDEIWNLSDERMVALATEELSKIGIIDAAEVLDSTVLRMEKTYPAYFGTYDRFAEIREHVDRYDNLFLIGRNGMHRYNNQDHSMLTAMMAVDDIIAGKTDKTGLWEVNTEMDYHEGEQRLPVTGRAGESPAHILAAPHHHVQTGSATAQRHQFRGKVEPVEVKQAQLRVPQADGGEHGTVLAEPTEETASTSSRMCGAEGSGTPRIGAPAAGGAFLVLHR